MDNYELLKITEGQNRKKSLVYHILDRKKGQNYELLIHTVCRNSILLTSLLLVNEFHGLTFEDQMSKLEFYCIEFGLFTSDQALSDFDKVLLHFEASGRS